MESYTKIKIFLSILILIFLIFKLKDLLLDLLTPIEEFLKAAENGNLKKIKSMLNKEVNIKTLINAVDKENNTALILASKFGYIEVVKILIENGADIDARNNENSTALIEASSFYYEVVKLLIENGADINAKDYGGTTALMNASTEDDYINCEICKTLIENGANVNDKDLQGANALIYGSTFLKWDLSIIKLLIDSGIEINAQDKDGYTALMEATISGNYETVKLLIENGADINIKNNDGKTALDFAEENDYKNIIELLKNSIDK